MQYDRFRAMNTDIVLAASGSDPGMIREGFLLARDFIQRSEDRFTRFTDTSELAELNRSAGSWFGCSHPPQLEPHAGWILAPAAVRIFRGDWREQYRYRARRLRSDDSAGDGVRDGRPPSPSRRKPSCTRLARCLPP